jgi:hypothetical protein
MSEISGAVGNCARTAWGRGTLAPCDRAFQQPGGCCGCRFCCPRWSSQPVCPDPPPSYAGQVGAIIQTYCVGCHGPGGLESNRPFQTWQDIDTHAYAGPMLQQLIACRMPPADAPQPSDVDKQTLIGWLTCGHPNN